MTETQAISEPPGLGQNRVSPFIPADQVPLQRNAPLAPSQELAYREKCIQLKRRLMEIEAENDTKRARIAREKQLQMKMRLNRAILMEKLREIMETRGGHPPTKQELVDMLGFDHVDGDEEDQSYEQLQAQSKKRRRVQTRDEEMLDDMSEDTDDDDPEPVERPIRTRRANDSAAPRDVLMGNTNSTPAAPVSYAPQPGMQYVSPANMGGLQTIAPAQSAAAFVNTNPVMGQLTSSFQVGTTAPVIAQPGQPIRFLDGTYDARPMPAASAHPLPPPMPARPAPPYEQFTDHMRPQLLRDSYPRDQMDARIKLEWSELSAENKGLWEARYEEQMQEYERGMDEVRKWQRRQQAGGQIVMGQQPQK